QFATWMGLFCMWLYFAPAVAHSVFGAPDAKSPLYQQGAEWASLCFSMYSLVAFLVAFLLPVLAAAIGKRGTHALCLLCGAAGLLGVGVIRQPWVLLLSMVGVGIAWASTVSMPYVILSNAVPAERTGVYMGIFNFFITLPEICASLGLGWVLSHWLHGNSLTVVLLGGVCLILAAILMRQVPAEEPAAAPAPAAQTV
ncbi:MAG: MFS transporter, partial [Bryobacteraceae bacterium]